MDDKTKFEKEEKLMDEYWEHGPRGQTLIERFGQEAIDQWKKELAKVRKNLQKE